MTGKQRAIDLAINAVETGIETKSEIARRYELPRSTLSTILKNKEKFKHMFATSKLKPGIKRCRLATYQDVEEALFSWFKQARCMNVPISGPIMKIKAKELALKMGHSEFQCSTGWLERFKQRHSIVFRRVTGEEGSVNEDMVRDWKSHQLPSLLEEFSPDDIFNADETDLFWKCLPDKMLSLKREKCSGGKRSKDRITVLVCSNRSGSEKLPLLVIGKFAKPRCFKNARSIPVQYEANKRAWMVSDIFSSWLSKLDIKCQKKEGK